MNVEQLQSKTMSMDEISSSKDNRAQQYAKQERITQEKELQEKKDTTEAQQAKSEIAKLYEENKISTLDAKIVSGRELSKDEMDYLKVKNRDSYDTAIDVSKEKQAYKERLESAKSKEEVRDTQNNELQKFAAEADVIANNSKLGKTEKKEELDKLNAKMAGVSNEHSEFVVSAEYMELPGSKSKEYTPQMPISSGASSDAAEKAKISFEEVKAKISAALEENYRRQIQELPTSHEQYEFLTQVNPPAAEALELDKKG